MVGDTPTGGHSHRGTLPQGDTRFWFGLRLVLAVFFLLAAFLKWQAFVSGVPSAVSEVAPQLEWGLIQFEFLLAIWLLSGWATSALWWVLVALFSIFTGAGLYQVWIRTDHAAQPLLLCRWRGVVED